MTYIRIIPRDLFNEGNLLKCLGTLSIALERVVSTAKFDVEDVEYFDIRQDPNDGSLAVANLPFSIAGKRAILSRPLNSRQAFPLYLAMRDDPAFDPIPVFQENGSLSGEMLDLIRPEAK